MTRQRRVAVMVDLDWPYKRHTEVHAACQRYAAEAGWECVIHPFVDQDMKSGGDYDGVLARATRQLADEARRTGVPVVNVWVNSPARSLPSVFPDVEEAGAMAARHLLGRGFRQFGFLGYLRDRASQLELKGFRSVIEASGFTCFVHQYSPAGPTRARIWGAFIGALEAWVDTWKTPVGVYGGHDLACRYLINVCRARGLAVPQDVAIIGGGNELALCMSAPPTLTSIDLGYGQIGYRAAELLDRLMDGEAPPAEPVLIASAELIGRLSTDSYAVDDPVVARALRFIAEHSHEPIKVDDVAAAAPTTRRSLERRFQKTMRRTISQEILRLRLERAKRRLTEADEPLKKVASASGFSNPTHFYRAFVRLEGISPKEYRKQRRSDA